MKIILSPAKSLNFNCSFLSEYTLPQFMERSLEINQRLRAYSATELMELMHISRKLAELNYQRNADFSAEFTAANARSAIIAFNGDVYEGLQATTFSTTDFAFAQKHLRILSGLYGMLRPLDLIQPYRLEMGTKLSVAGKKNLYEYWGNTLTEHLQNELAPNEPLINLASEEYAKVIRIKELKNPVITPIFKDYKNGTAKVISFYAKVARGKMAHFAIVNRIMQATDLKLFNSDGYAFNENLSTENQWVFLR